MKYSFSIYTLLLSFCCYWLVSCVPAKPVLPDSPSLPAAFNTASSLNDSGLQSAGKINWKVFFNDPVLQQLIDTGIQHNLDLKMAVQRIEMAKSGHLQARGLLRPELNLTLGASLRRFGLYTMDGAGNITTDITPGKIVPTNLPDYFPALQASWEVDIWGRLKNMKRSALARVMASYEARQLLTTETVAELAISYYELMALNETIRSLNRNIAIQQEVIQIMQVQKQTGRINELAIKQFEALTNNLRTSSLEIQQSMREEQNRINLLTGKFSQVVQPDTANHNWSAFTASISTGTPAELLQNRPDIRQAELELQATKMDLHAARAAFYPSLVLSGNAGLQAFSMSYLFNTPESIAYGIFGGLTAPFLNRAAIKAGFQQAGAAQLEALYNYQKTILTAYTEVSNEENRFRNLKEMIQLKQEEVNLLTASVDISNELFIRGRVTYLDVLVAQQSALNAEINLIELNKRLQQAKVNIYRSLGGGWNNQ